MHIWRLNEHLSLHNSKGMHSTYMCFYLDLIWGHITQTLKKDLSDFPVYKDGTSTEWHKSFAGYKVRRWDHHFLIQWHHHFLFAMISSFFVYSDINTQLLPSLEYFLIEVVAWFNILLDFTLFDLTNPNFTF